VSPLTNHDRRYLRTVGKILAAEGVLTRAELEARARPWLPAKWRRNKAGKPTWLIFPRKEDYAFVWNQYLLRRAA
jgi:hypothetical protein